MEINIEKFICSRMRQLKSSKYGDVAFDIMQSALREQGLVYKNGKIYKIGEEPEDPKLQFLVYDRPNDKFDVVSEAPKHNEFETFLGVPGTNYLISATDYTSYLVKKLDKDIKKK